MRRTDNYASNQIKLLLTGLNGSSHAEKKKAILAFQTYVETYQPEVADETVDFLFTGCINGKLGTGLLHWAGATSGTGNNVHLKRICRHAVNLIRWLVTHESESERGNFYYTRFIQLAVMDLKQLNVPKHCGVKNKKKKVNEQDENESVFVLVAILMNEHRNSQGKIAKIDLDDLLLFDEEAHIQYADWCNSGAIEQIPNYRGDKHREEVIDRPACWEEVIFRCIPLQEGEEDANEVEEEKDVIPPIPDPLGISSVDLRSIQAFYTQGRLMKSQTGQLARRTSTAAMMPIDGVAPMGGRKTSFRGSTTFAPYVNDDDDDDSNDDEDSDTEEADQAQTMRVGFEESKGSNSGGGGGGGDRYGSSGGGGGGGGGNDNSGARDRDGTDPMGTLQKARSVSGAMREKKIVASVVPSDKNFSTALFLTLVHGSVSFNQLRAGQDHLQQHLMLQSSRRENLVRLHFGLFVQCAEGLEFLKAYRKGVLKVNEIRNRRGSYARKSILEDSKTVKDSNGKTAKDANSKDKDKDKTPTAGTISSADKGLERLKRSQTTLEAAKVEAQRTLAPILERMKQSRRIKSAEKVLKRMTAILEYPMRMRTAFEKGDLSEVVNIYQRVQAVPTSSSSLRIMHKIKESAAVVIAELKKQCFTQLMSPTANYASLLRYGKIWQDLEGDGSYFEILRQCLIRQVLHFVEKIKELRDKFCADCADANDRGLEQNLLRRSPFLAVAGALSGERESISVLVRRHADTALNRRRLSIRHMTHPGDSSETSGGGGGNRSRTQSENVMAGAAWGDSDGMDFREQRDEFALEEEESDEDWQDVEDEEDEFIDGDIDDLDFLDDISPAKKRSLTFSDQLNGESTDEAETSSQGGGRAVRRGSSQEANHSVLLCALVRQGYVEAMVDLLAKWFPCMFRLVSNLSNANPGHTAPPPPTALLRSTSSKPTANGPASAGASGGSAPAGKAGTAAAGSSNTAAFVNLNRGAIAPARILGAALKIFGEYLKQVISGVESSFSTLNLPSELNSAFNEIDAYLAQTHYPIPSVTPVVINLTSGLRYDNKAYDAIASSVLFHALREPFHRDALQEVYDLYNAMEFIMKREAAAILSAATAASAAAAASNSAGAVTANFMHTRVPFGAAAGKNNLNFLSPTSPYFDSMTTLQALSKEGEMALAQKIMDRLWELASALHACDPDLRRAALLGNTHRAGAGAGGSVSKSVFGISTSSAALHTTEQGGQNQNQSQSQNQLALLGNKARRRGSVLLEEEFDAAGGGGGGASKSASVGMEANVTELGDLIIRCLKSLRQKVKREEWVAVVVQEGVQKVFTSFAEALRRESLRVNEGSSGARSRNSVVASSNSKRGGRGGSNLRSSIGNGLVLETLEEEMKFGDADSYKALVQLDLLRACVRLRCACVPYIGAEMKKVFALLEDADATDKSNPAYNNKNNNGEVSAQNPNANTNGNIKGDKDKAGPTGVLNRTKSSLMTKLFTSTDREDAISPPVVSPASPASPVRQMKDIRKKLTLIDILKMAIKLNSVELFDQNLREVISIEDQAASTYVGIKTKEVRTTIFAGFALLVHSESSSMWQPLPGGGAIARIPVHLARVLLTLGNERRKLAEALGDLHVMRGDNAAAAAEEDAEEGQTPAPAPAPAPTAGPASRSLFAQVDPDSDSDADRAVVEESKNSPKRAYCEALLYRDHLYKQLCVGLLQIYQDLIRRLRTNSFHDDAPDLSDGNSNNPARRGTATRGVHHRTGADMFSSVPEGDEDESSDDEAGESKAAKMPFCLGQAIEEYNYLKTLLMPLLDNDLAVSYSEAPIAAVDLARNQTQDSMTARYCGKQFASTAQLTLSGRMFAMMINGQGGVKY